MLPFFTLLLAASVSQWQLVAAYLDQAAEQNLHNRLFQTAIRGPRWTGNDNQNTLTDLVATSLGLAGLDVETIEYNFARWDPRWWSLTLNLKNGTALGLPTTGYRPFSGNTGLTGVTAVLNDGGLYGINASTVNPDGNNATLKFENFGAEPSIMIFDDPSPTRNYSLPGYELLGTSRDIDASEIPELGNLSNPHWQSAKKLKWDILQSMNIVGTIAGWVNSSDENGALQWLPNVGPDEPGEAPFQVPSLYVGESTLGQIRQLSQAGEVANATIVLDAPTYNTTSHTIISRLKGTGNSNDSMLLYTHSDGPTIIEENGPIILLAIAEHFARYRPYINLDFVVTTGHISGGVLDEERWMEERPYIVEHAKAAILCEHFGAIEWKDDFTTGKPVYQATGRNEPMWTMANTSMPGNEPLRQAYIDSFSGTSDELRMAMLTPHEVDGVVANWFGVGGSKTLAKTLPTLGIIPQPDYLWAAMTDGGWSKLNFPLAVEQVNVILRTVDAMDKKYQAGEL